MIFVLVKQLFISKISTEGVGLKPLELASRWLGSPAPLLYILALKPQNMLKPHSRFNSGCVAESIILFVEKYYYFPIIRKG